MRGSDVCQMADANSQEFAPETRHPVIVSMPEHNVEQKGGTMRLGERVTVFKERYFDSSMMYKLYGKKKGGGVRDRDHGASPPPLRGEPRADRRVREGGSALRGDVHEQRAHGDCGDGA